MSESTNLEPRAAALFEAMATGARLRADADLALAVTGVTGAEPDEDGNSVGRVFIGFATSKNVVSLHCEFGRLAPEAPSHLAVQAALTFALSQLAM